MPIELTARTGAGARLVAIAEELSPQLAARAADDYGGAGQKIVFSFQTRRRQSAAGGIDTKCLEPAHSLLIHRIRNLGREVQGGQRMHEEAGIPVLCHQRTIRPLQ